MQLQGIKMNHLRTITSLVLAVPVLILVIGCRSSSTSARRTATGNMARAMTNVAPPDQVVMARNRNNPTSDEYLLMPDQFRLGKASVRKAPTCWVELAREVEKRDVPAWTPVIFMHGRRASASGDELLVVLEVESRFTGDGFYRPGPELHVVARTLGHDGQGRPIVLHTNQRALNLGQMWSSTIYAGQPDPADPAHFTIRYEIEGISPRQVDGWLQKDGALRLTKTD